MRFKRIVGGYMTNIERAMNILHFKEADRLPAVHFGYWNDLLFEWAEHGHIPLELAKKWRDGNDADKEIDKIIGWDFNWYTTAGGSIKLFPQFERKVLENRTYTRVCHEKLPLFLRGLHPCSIKPFCGNIRPPFVQVRKR